MFAPIMPLLAIVKLEKSFKQNHERDNSANNLIERPVIADKLTNQDMEKAELKRPAFAFTQSDQRLAKACAL